MTLLKELGILQVWVPDLRGRDPARSSLPKPAGLAAEDSTGSGDWRIGSGDTAELPVLPEMTRADRVDPSCGALGA